MSMHAIADGHLALPARTTRIADASSRRQRSCAQMASSAQLSARAQLRAGFALRQRAAVSGKAHQRTGRAARGTVRVTAMLPAEAVSCLSRKSYLPAIVSTSALQTNSPVTATPCKQGSSALEKGKAMYAKGDRMEALKVFEEELKKDVSSTRQSGALRSRLPDSRRADFQLVRRECMPYDTPLTYPTRCTSAVSAERRQAGAPLLFSVLPRCVRRH